MSQIKRLNPKIPVEIRGFLLTESKEGLKESLDALVGDMPLIIQELPQVEGSTGFGLRIHHVEDQWNLDVQSGDWIISDNYGSVMAIPDAEVENQFDVTDLPAE